MAQRFEEVVDEAPASRFEEVTDEVPAQVASEEVTQQEDYVFPAGSPSARTPMVYQDKPSFEESFPIDG